MNFKISILILFFCNVIFSQNVNFNRVVNEIKINGLTQLPNSQFLIEVLISKTVTSAGVSQDLFRFISEGTKLIEAEGGIAANESSAIALQKAIEAGVLEIIKVGITRGYWKYE